MRPKSELAWKLMDYQAAGVDPPHRIVVTPEATEGDLMSEEEVAEYLADTTRTLRVLRDRPTTYERVLDSFMADLVFLLKIGRIEEDDYNELTNELKT
jgi:hypothetical protein